jgi:hypothetical protein
MMNPKTRKPKKRDNVGQASARPGGLKAALRRHRFGDPAVSDDELLAAADEVFLAYDRREADE